MSVTTDLRTVCSYFYEYETQEPQKTKMAKNQVSWKDQARAKENLTFQQTQLLSFVNSLKPRVWFFCLLHLLWHSIWKINPVHLTIAACCTTQNGQNWIKWQDYTRKHYLLINTSFRQKCRDNYWDWNNLWIFPLMKFDNNDGASALEESATPPPCLGVHIGMILPVLLRILILPAIVLVSL